MQAALGHADAALMHGDLAGGVKAVESLPPAAASPDRESGSPPRGNGLRRARHGAVTDQLTARLGGRRSRRHTPAPGEQAASTDARAPATHRPCAAGGLAVFIADRPGTVAVVWQGWRIDTSVAVLVLAVVFVAMAAAALFHLLRKILGGPRAFMRSRRERRRRDGYRALTQGMVAVAAGDAEEAEKFARRADVLLAEPPLTLLLSAQAAQLKGDDRAAQRYFAAMLERKETEFLGLRGLIMQALRGGDEGTALTLIERAKTLRPSTPWVLSSLFELQARAGKWREAEATLRRGGQAQGAARLPRAATAKRCCCTRRAGRRKPPARRARRSSMPPRRIKLDPAFAPATVRYADLLRAGGKRRPAAKAIESGWRAQPHPALAEAYGALFAEEPPVQRLKHVEQLAGHNPGHRESRLALAGAALAARLWGEARRHLEAAGAARRRRHTADAARLPPHGRARAGRARQSWRGARLALPRDRDEQPRRDLYLRCLRQRDAAAGRRSARIAAASTACAGAPPAEQRRRGSPPATASCRRCPSRRRGRARARARMVRRRCARLPPLTSPDPGCKVRRLHHLSAPR